MSGDADETTRDAVRRRIADAIAIKQRMLDDECVAVTADVADRMVAALRAGGKVIFFGNGGSSMDAGHLAAELVGRFYRDRPALAAISLPSAATCRAKTSS